MSNFDHISHCPNCRREVNTTSCRLILESCGHNKCRLCVAEEVDGCLECLSEKNKSRQVEIHSPCKIKSEWAKLSLVENFKEPQVVCLNGNERGHQSKGKKLDIISEIIIPPQNIKHNQGDDDADSMEITQPLPSNSTAKNVKKAFSKTLQKSSNKESSSHIVKIQTATGSVFHCTICDNKFQSRSGKLRHKYCDTSLEKKYTCNECSRQFATSDHFEYHKRTHQAITILPCDQCDRTYKEPSSLERHKRRHHMKIFKFSCNECEKKFFDKDSFVAHQVSHTEEPAPFCCETCGKRYRFRYNLKEHMKSHSEEEPTKFSCTCGKSYLRKTTLERHKLKHKTKINCYDCGLLFYDVFNFRRHVLKHKDVKQSYVCSICKIDVNRKDNFLRHCRTLHADAILNDILKDSLTTYPTKSIEDLASESEKASESVTLLVDSPLTTVNRINDCKMKTTVEDAPITAIQSAPRSSVITFVGKSKSENQSEQEPSNESSSYQIPKQTLNKENWLISNCSKDGGNLNENRNIASPNEKTKSSETILAEADQSTLLSDSRNVSEKSVEQTDATSVQKKQKKTNDSVQIYRQILSLDPIDDDDDEIGDTAVEDDESVNAISNQQVDLHNFDLQRPKENFGETHWRKQRTLYFWNHNNPFSK